MHSTSTPLDSIEVLWLLGASRSLCTIACVCDVRLSTLGKPFEVPCIALHCVPSFLEMDLVVTSLFQLGMTTHAKHSTPVVRVR